MVITNPCISTESRFITSAKPYCEDLFAIVCIIDSVTDRDVYTPSYCTGLESPIDNEHDSC